MRTPNMPSKRAFSLGLAAVLALGGAVAIGGSSDAATVGKITASPATGSAGVAGKVVTLTGSGFKSGSTVKVDTAANGGVQFQSAACSSTVGVDDGSTILNVTLRQVPSATQIVIKTPALGSVSDTTAKKWNICVYASASGNALLAAGTYSTLGAPSITGPNSPTSGASAGGDVVTITGTNFGKSPKVFFGTVQSPKVTVAKDGLSVDAVTPPHDAGAVDVSVQSDGGTNPTPTTSTDDDFTYLNAVQVTEDTGDGGATNDISVTGVGFSTLDFSRTGSSGATAYGPSAVYLVRGAYNPTISAGAKTNAEVATCGTPTVISDTQLSCTVPATSGSFTNGAYTVTVVKDTRIVDSSVAAGSNTSTKVHSTSDFPTNNVSVVSSSATYTVAPF